MTTCLPFHKRRVLRHFCLGMRSNRFSFHFFAFSFSPFLIFLLQWLTFYWAYFPFKIKTSEKASSRQAVFPIEVAMCSGMKFWSEFFTQISEHFRDISGSIEPITLIWVSLERSFPLAEVKRIWSQLWSKVMTSEVEQRPRLVTSGYWRHGSQRVNWKKVFPLV